MNRKMKTISFVIVITMFVCASAVWAETLVWGIDGHFAYGDVIDVDFGRQLTGISSVEMRIAGLGGGWNFVCDFCCDPEDVLRGTVPFQLLFDFEPELAGGPGASTSYWTPVFEAFDVVLTPTATAGNEDWGFLNDGVMSVALDEFVPPYPAPWPTCYGVGQGSYGSEVERVEFIVDCATAVAAERSTWGTIKSLYR